MCDNPKFGAGRGEKGGENGEADGGERDVWVGEKEGMEMEREKLKGKWIRAHVGEGLRGGTVYVPRTVRTVWAAVPYSTGQYSSVEIVIG